MASKRDHRKRDGPKNKTELVKQYREIGIPAVAAAARYQDAATGTARPRPERTESRVNRRLVIAV